MPALPNTPFVTGGPTGSAMPLAWAHAEYIKLVRSISDGKVFDKLQVVAERYQPPPGQPPYLPSKIEVWNFARPIPSILLSEILRIPLGAAFRLRWTNDDWATWVDTDATATSVGIYFVDLPAQTASVGSSFEFTFFWTVSQHWEGRNFAVEISA